MALDKPLALLERQSLLRVAGNELAAEDCAEQGHDVGGAKLTVAVKVGYTKIAVPD